MEGAHLPSTASDSLAQKVKLDGIVFPELAENVNRSVCLSSKSFFFHRSVRATKATIQLKHMMIEGEKRLRRYLASSSLLLSLSSYQLPRLNPLSPLPASSGSVSSISPPKHVASRQQTQRRQSGLLSSQSQDSLVAQKRTKEKQSGSAIHTAPFRLLKRHPQDMGLKLSAPSSQK